MAERAARREDIVFWNEMSKREYPNRSKIHVVTADIVFDGRMMIDLGGEVTVELIHCKGPQSSDSVLCYVPSDQFVLLGYSNCKDLYGYPWNFDIAHEEENADEIPYDREKVDEYLRLLDTLDFTMCISGHAKTTSKEALYTGMMEE